MCGIYGFIGKPTNKTKKAIRQLGIFNLERGTDSSGIAIYTDKSFYYYKKAINVEDFYNTIRPERHINSGEFSNFVNIIGHTRQATIGAINDINSHPYLLDKLIFAHNGVINNFDDLQNKYNTSFQVDSQMIGYLLENSKNDIEAFQKLKGWFTVPYIKFNNIRTLNIATYNAPLHFALNDTGLYYSSQKNHLKMALERADIKASIGVASNNKIYNFTWINETITINKININMPSYYYDNYYYNRYCLKYDWRK